MTVRIRVRITIDASPTEVWAEVKHVERHSEWMADAKRIEFTSKKRQGVGAEADVLTRVGPFISRDRMVVTEWKARRAMTIAHTGAVTGTGRFTLRRARGGRTRFGWEERLRFPWWMGGPVGERLAKPVLKRIWRANLQTLKARVEQ